MPCSQIVLTAYDVDPYIRVHGNHDIGKLQETGLGAQYGAPCKASKNTLFMGHRIWEARKRTVGSDETAFTISADVKAMTHWRIQSHLVSDLLCLWRTLEIGIKMKNRISNLRQDVRFVEHLHTTNLLWFHEGCRNPLHVC